MSDLSQTFNKVVVKTSGHNLTVLDLSEDTVTPQTLYSGITAHNRTGESIIGKAISNGSAIIVDDYTIKINDAGEIYVNTAKNVEQDNNLPITAAAVYAEIGNIDALL